MKQSVRLDKLRLALEAVLAIVMEETAAEAVREAGSPRADSFVFVGVWSFFCFCFCFLFFLFQDRVSLCSPGCPGIHSVVQAGLELRNPPASASQVLGLKACATTARHFFCFVFLVFFSRQGFSV